MTQDENGMHTYRMKHKTQGVPIDRTWQAFLIKELKFERADIGDYFYYDIEGTPRIMDKSGFERLFELHDTP